MRYKVNIRRNSKPSGYAILITIVVRLLYWFTMGPVVSGICSQRNPAMCGQLFNVCFIWCQNTCYVWTKLVGIHSCPWGLVILLYCITTTQILKLSFPLCSCNIYISGAIQYHLQWHLTLLDYIHYDVLISITFRVTSTRETVASPQMSRYGVLI